MRKRPTPNEVMPSAVNSADSTELVLTTSAEPRVDSRLLAKHLGNKHKSLMALIEKYSARIKSFGQLPFKKEVGGRVQGGGNAERFALLNENQAFFVLALSRNTDRVVTLKGRLIRSFSNARRAAAVRQTEYLPAYRDLQDGIHALAAGSKNERFIHINAAKAVNKAVGIEAGKRPGAALPVQSLLTVANMLAAGAVHSATDCHQIQERIHAALSPIKALTARHTGTSLEVQ